MLIYWERYVGTHFTAHICFAPCVLLVNSSLFCTYQDSFSALALACKSGHTEMVEILLAIPGCDVNVQSNVSIKHLPFAAVPNSNDDVFLL